MAFGFTRAPGTARGYVNESNPDYAPGQRLSRRQYDKYLEKLGKRTHLPGVEAIAETERLLEETRQSLATRAADLDTREAALALREAELAFEQQLFRKGRHSAGQRRYNALLDAYVAEERRQGKRINKKQAAASPAFKSIVKDVKGRANPKKNLNLKDENRFARMKALDRLGGSAVFRDYYEKLYGQIAAGNTGARVRAAARNRSQGILANGRSRFTVRRAVSRG